MQMIDLPLTNGSAHHRRRTHAAQVGLARTGRGGLVLELLIRGVRVDGGDEAALDAEGVLEDLGERGQSP